MSSTDRAMPVAKSINVIAHARRFIAVNHGNGDQGAKSLKQNSRPFNSAYGRLADDNALAPCIKCCMQRSYQFWLSRSLARIGGLYSEGIMQCPDQSRG